jgi:hypothetical protein
MQNQIAMTDVFLGCGNTHLRIGSANHFVMEAYNALRQVEVVGPARVTYPCGHSACERKRERRRAMRLVLAVLCLVTSGVVVVGGSQNLLAQRQERLNSRIPAPIRAKYKGIRDAKDWLNPKITIRSDGVEISNSAIPGGQKTVALGDLRRVLVTLPVSAWPYGRVVLASDIGLRSGDRSEDKLIGRNHVEAENILKLLGIEIDWWPPA